MHLPHQIIDLAIILGVAGIVTFIFQKIKQPVVLGYVVAGIIVGPYTSLTPTVSDIPNIRVWAELGVIFLMFSLGLEFTFHKLARVGRTAFGTAIVEVVLMVLVGYITGKALGWSRLDSLFLGGILSISSTTIIIKAFDELGLRTRKFAEIVFGVLIVEDLVAILLLVALSTVALTQSLFSTQLLVEALKLVLIVGSWFLIGYFIIPSFFRYAGKMLDNQTVTVISVGLCLGLVIIASHFEYSTALGAFIMGSILAETSESERIEHLIQPVKDLFSAVFFVSVGMMVDPSILKQHFGTIALITAVTIVGKTLSTTLGSLMTGQPLKRSVQIGFSLAQIGEFSFIIATLGSTLKVTSDFLYPIAVTVSVATTFTTPYLIRFSERFAGWLEKRLPSRMQQSLEAYAAWNSNSKRESSNSGVEWVPRVRFAINSLIVTVIFILMSEFALPYFEEKLSASSSVLVAWIVSVVLCSPFIWGMFFASMWREVGGQRSHRGASVVAQLLTVVWLGVLSSAFFSSGKSAVLTVLPASIAFALLYRRLELFYRWLEKTLVFNFNAKTEESEDHALTALAPWDVHLVRLKIHQNSSLTGKHLKESQIRSAYGLNIVAMQRGEMVIAAPGADSVLFPGDELLVLGNDEQIDRFRKIAESPSGDRGDGRNLIDYSLQRIFIKDQSPLLNQSIRDSKLRETLRGLIVGLERGPFRTINPDPEVIIQSGDVLWILSGLH